MPLFVWRCGECGAVKKKILPKRPDLGVCVCGGAQGFLSDQSQRVVEIIDNGLMAKKIERLPEIRSLLAARRDKELGKT